VAAHSSSPRAPKDDNLAAGPGAILTLTSGAVKGKVAGAGSLGSTPTAPCGVDTMPTVLTDLALRLIDEASQRGITLRLTGSLGVRGHCAESAALLEALGRELPQDVDLFGLSRQHRDLTGLFKSLGFEAERALAHSHEYGIQRLIYYAPPEGTKVEVFLDLLRMSHTLDFRGRLEADYPTLSVADLLLAKLQIFRITDKDVKDIVALLGAHDLNSRERESVDLPYLLRLTREDWGLYFTLKKNLGVIRERLGQYPELPGATRAAVERRLQELEERIESEPKALRWRMRAAVGTRMPWYEEVENVER